MQKKRTRKGWGRKQTGRKYDESSSISQEYNKHIEELDYSINYTCATRKQKQQRQKSFH